MILEKNRKSVKKLENLGIIGLLRRSVGNPRRDIDLRQGLGYPRRGEAEVPCHARRRERLDWDSLLFFSDIGGSKSYNCIKISYTK